LCLSAFSGLSGSVVQARACPGGRGRWSAVIPSSRRARRRKRARAPAPDFLPEGETATAARGGRDRPRSHRPGRQGGRPGSGSRAVFGELRALPSRSTVRPMPNGGHCHPGTRFPRAHLAIVSLWVDAGKDTTKGYGARSPYASVQVRCLGRTE